jgi:amino acid transporter
MKISVKVVLILFTLIMLFFTIYQAVLGNPFADEVHPVLVLFLLFLMGAGSVVFAFIHRKS